MSKKPYIASVGNGQVTISGLTEYQQKLIEGMMHGEVWMSMQDGGLHSRAVHESLPDPIADDEMLPFWRRFAPTSGSIQEELFDRENLQDHFSHAIVIQALCGYHYTPENYCQQAAKLQSYGFVHLRSKRSEDGRYYELWWLPGLWLARGALKDAIDKNSNKRDSLPDSNKSAKINLKSALDFLGQMASFGSLDVTVQRLAMTMHD